jgi:peptidoglycan/LPS O-acetylase OafA/YrhL
MFQDWSSVPHTALNAAFYFATGLGADAVVVFFVLSGFWVGGSVLTAVKNNSFRWRDYLISRGSRLWIALVPAVFLTVVLAWIGLAGFPSADILAGHQGYHSLVKPDIAADLAPLVVLGNLFFLQGVVVPVIGTNGPLWSLAYEFWYYVLFPALLIAVTRGSRGKRVLHGFIGIVVALTIGPDILALFPVWLLGVIVAYYKAKISALLIKLNRGATLLQAVAGLLLIVSVVSADVVEWPVPFSAWTVAVPAALFIATLVDDARMDSVWFIPLRGAARYAQASYSLYVSHLPIAILACAMVIPLASSRFDPSPISLTLFVIAIIVLMSIAWGFAWMTEFRTSWFRQTLNRIIPGSDPLRGPRRVPLR